MREVIAICSPWYWSLKNRLFRSGPGAWIKPLFMIALYAGFCAGIFTGLWHLLPGLSGMEGDAGNLIAMKGLSLILMTVFFMLIFSSLLAGISAFYLAEDLTALLASPVRMSSLYTAKWLEASVKSSWMIVCAFLPLFAGLGAFYHPSPVYYFLLLPLITGFVATATGLGIIICIILMALIPARRARNVFTVLGLLSVAIVLLLFRLLQPERLANPEWFANMTMFLAEMKAPVSVLLPGTWLTETLVPFFAGTAHVSPLYPLLLLFTPCSLMITGQWLFTPLYHRGVARTRPVRQDAYRRTAAYPVRVFINALVTRVIRYVCRGPGGAVTEKDMITFFRSVGQSSQLLLLVAVVIIYLFSIRALPVDWAGPLSTRLRYVIAFLNTGLVGFVITAVAARLVLPRTAGEGRAFWIIRVSPMSMGRFLWSKFLSSFVPLLVLAEVLLVVSNIFLGIKAGFIISGALTVFFNTWAITGLATGIGARSADFSSQDRSGQKEGLHGSLFMISSIAVILLTCVLELFPGAVSFLQEAGSAELTLKGRLSAYALFLAVPLLNCSVMWIAMKAGCRRLANLE